MSKKPLSLLLSSVLVLLVGCAKTEEPAAPVEPTTTPAAEPAPAPAGVTVSSINLGKSIDADKKIAAPLETFAKGDTIYVTVDTAGAGPATVKAKWTYTKGGQTTVVKEDSQTLTGPGTTEFHISKPDGWPAGDYQVEVFVDDKSAGTKTFTVK